jgi:hypothetical protein
MRLKERRGKAWILVVGVALATVVGGLGLAAGFQWSKRFRREAARCEREAAHWEAVAKDARASSTAFAALGKSYTVEYVRNGVKGSRTLQTREPITHANFMAHQATVIAGLYRQEAKSWKAWTVPEVQVDSRTYWRMPDKAELEKYAPW